MVSALSPLIMTLSFASPDKIGKLTRISASGFMFHLNPSPSSTLSTLIFVTRVSEIPALPFKPVSPPPT